MNRPQSGIQGPEGVASLKFSGFGPGGSTAEMVLSAVPNKPVSAGPGRGGEHERELPQEGLDILQGPGGPRQDRRCGPSPNRC